MAIQRSQSIESGRQLIGSEIRSRSVVHRHLRRLVGGIHECPIHLLIDWFTFCTVCHLTGRWPKVLVGCIVHGRPILIEGGVLVV